MLDSRSLLAVCTAFLVCSLVACQSDSSDPEVPPDPKNNVSGKADATADTLQEELDLCQEDYDQAMEAAQATSSFLQASYAAAECSQVAIDGTVPTIESFLAENESSYTGQTSKVIDEMRQVLSVACRLSIDASEGPDGTLRNVVQAGCIAENENRIAALVRSSLLAGEAPFAFDERYPACDAAYSLAVEDAMSQQDFLQASYGLARCLEYSLERTNSALLEGALINFPDDQVRLEAEIGSMNDDFMDAGESFCGLAAGAASGDYDDIGNLTKAICFARTSFVFDQLMLSHIMPGLVQTTDATDATLQADLDVCQGTYDAAMNTAQSTAEYLQASYAAADCSSTAISATVPTVESYLEDNESRYAGQTLIVIDALRLVLADGCQLAIDASDSPDGTLRNVVQAGCIAENENRIGLLVQSSLLGGEASFEFDERYPTCDAAYNLAIDEAMSQQDYLQATYRLIVCIIEAVELTYASLLAEALVNFPEDQGRLEAAIVTMASDLDKASLEFCGLAGGASSGDDASMGRLVDATCSARVLNVYDTLLRSYIAGL